MPSAFAHRTTDFDLKSKELVELVDSHSSLKLESFSGDIAYRLGGLIREIFLNGYFKEHPESGIIIAIKTLADHTLFAATAGEDGRTGPGNWAWAARKEKVVKALGKSSFWVGRFVESIGAKPEDLGLPFPEYGCHGGGFPLYVESNTAGPVAIVLVSGLPQEEDHQLIIDALEAFIASEAGTKASNGH